jgi:hypothetical protein
MYWTNANGGQLVIVRMLACHATGFVSIVIVDAAARTAGTATCVFNQRRVIVELRCRIGCTAISIRG